MEDTNFVKKPWDIEQMRKRVDNLKKRLGPTIVEIYLYQSFNKTNNELDALYLTYYGLKERCLKYRRCVFGRVKEVQFKRKVDNKWYYVDYDNIIGDYTYTLAEKDYGQLYRSFDQNNRVVMNCNNVYGPYNLYDAYNTVLTARQSLASNVTTFNYNYCTC